jgi:hypothetical protein
MRFLSAFILILGVAAPAAAQDMVGLSWSGDAYAISSGTGGGAFLGSTGYSQINCMARDGAGTLYAASGNGVPVSIITINPATGAGTLVVVTSLLSIRGMAFLGSTLYAINDSSGTGFGVDDLYSISLATGAATLIGSTGYLGVQGLTAAGGALYAWEIGSGNCVGAGLITVNTASGAATDVNAAVDNQVCDIQTLCTSNGGGIYAAQSNLYSVDAATGVATFVGGGGYSDLRGIEFAAGGGGFALAKSGTCPGAITLTTSAGTPGGPQAFLYGGTGSFTWGGTPCTGLTVPIASPTLAGILLGNGAGSATVSFNAPAGLCGATVVAVDVSSCTTSNAIVL